MAALLAVPAMAQQRGQKVFPSPEEASAALVSAAERNDQDAMIGILGRDAKQIVSSGDDAEDASNRANFVQRYQEMHRLVAEPDGSTVLYVGPENWPTPIPLVSKGHSWYFDTEAGKKEILYRRIGQNETSAIGVCQMLVAAQEEYCTLEPRQYARNIISEPGLRNGLYWKAAEGEPQSPIGPLVASAAAQGYGTREGAPVPYCGYYYRILTRQGQRGPGGAKNYIKEGRMTGGFAFVAYPAKYRSSGVMTFIVAQDGVVLQKDLGRKTDVLARGMMEYNPGSGWAKADELL
ncbi:MAG: DUF2950 domain-containing protein [Holophaga sp.]